MDKKHDMLSAYNYWKSALERWRRLSTSKENKETTTTTELSSSFSQQPISKERAVAHHAPIEAYDYAIEFMSEQELDEIIADPDDVRMQALLIRERILGPTHPDTTYYIRFFFHFVQISFLKFK